MTKKNWETVAHIGLGFVAGLLNLRLLLNLREFRQLPPENNRYPVLWVDLRSRSGFSAFPSNVAPNLKEYWSKVRVMDTLNDSWEYRVGETIAWFVLVGGLLWWGWR